MTFSPEEELFYRRYDNGYDLYDPKYMSWLSIHHPLAASIISSGETFGLVSAPSVTALLVDDQPIEANSVSDNSSSSGSVVEHPPVCISQPASTLPATSSTTKAKEVKRALPEY